MDGDGCVHYHGRSVLNNRNVHRVFTRYVL